jgi:hypothetical protein
MAVLTKIRSGTVAEKLTWLAAVLVSAFPGAAAFRAWRGGWLPSSDWAVPVVLAWDTFSKHPPVIGQWTSLSEYGSKNVFQLGPLQFWLLAVPEHLFAPSPVGVLIGSALVATSAVVVALVVAWRRGGVQYLALATAVMALLLNGLGPQVIRDPYNPSIAVVCLIAYLACAWAVLDGDDWFWPVAAFFGSVSAQTHVTYLITLGVVGLVMVVGTLLRRRRLRRAGAPRRTRRQVIKIGATTFVVALFCWSGPLLNQIWGSGNLFAVLGSGFSGPRSVGPTYALHQLVIHLGVPPEWIFRAFAPATQTLDQDVLRQPTPTVFTDISALVVGIVFVIGLVRAVRARDAKRRSAGIVAAAGLVGAFLSSAKLPDTLVAVLSSTNRFLWWPVGAFAWFFVALTVADLIGALARRFRWRPTPDRLMRVGAAASLVVVLLAGGLLLSRASPAHDQVSASYGEIKTFSDVAVKACRESSGPVAVDGDGSALAATVGGLVAALLLHGCDVHTVNGRYFGFRRVIDGTEHEAFLVTGSDEPPEGYRLVATFDPGDPPKQYEGYDSIGLLMARRVSYLYQKSP